MRRMLWKHPSGTLEMRDGLDVEWWRFIQTSLPDTPFLPLPNVGASLEDILAAGVFTGFLLTGGDDWGVFPERDETETVILAFAEKKSLPVLGICRGAQVLNAFLGGSLLEVPGHAGKRHKIFSAASGAREVNSWHKLGIGILGSGLNALAFDADKHPEEFASADGKLHAIMWHPEREKIAAPHDIALMRKMFAEGHK